MCVAIFSTFMRYYVTYTMKLSNYIHFGTSINQLFETADNMYILPAHRATVYIMGIFLGYILRNFRNISLTKVDTDAYFVLPICTINFISEPTPNRQHLRPVMLLCLFLRTRFHGKHRLRVQSHRCRVVCGICSDSLVYRLRMDHLHYSHRLQRRLRTLLFVAAVLYLDQNILHRLLNTISCVLL
jgi:hypothetical protein